MLLQDTLFRNMNTFSCVNVIHLTTKTEPRRSLCRRPPDVKPRAVLTVIGCSVTLPNQLLQLTNALRAFHDWFSGLMRFPRIRPFGFRFYTTEPNSFRNLPDRSNDSGDWLAFILIFLHQIRNNQKVFESHFCRKSHCRPYTGLILPCCHPSNLFSS